MAIDMKKLLASLRAMTREEFKAMWLEANPWLAPGYVPPPLPPLEFLPPTACLTGIERLKLTKENTLLR